MLSKDFHFSFIQLRHNQFSPIIDSNKKCVYVVEFLFVIEKWVIEIGNMKDLT